MAPKLSMVPAVKPMQGKVTLEEAIQPPWAMEQATGPNIGLFVYPEREADYIKGVSGVEDRVQRARATGVGYTICSLTIPGVQGEADPASAEAFATRSNNWLAEQIKPYPTELGALGAVSMHNPEQAVVEMTRAIKELGFHGIMVNNWQQATDANGHPTLLLYDGPEYDVFWSALEKLDVPLYIHPQAPEGSMKDLLYTGDRHFLIGPPHSFAIDVSTHVMCLIVNGVFDRHPKAQIIIGHMAERMPYDFDRTHRWLELVEKSRGMGAKKTIYDYFKDNIWLTTSGQFSTAVLNFCMNLVGADRILFSVDYPYECYEDGAEWFDGLNINTRDKLKIGRENAKKLLKLGEYKDCNVEYHQ